MPHRLATLFQWIRVLGQRFFFQFGLHCATHQIRVILISCIVITSLFYPALSIYSSSQQNTHAFLDSFLSPETVSGFQAQKDLVNLWSGYDTLRVHDDPVSRAKCQVGRAVRVERVLIQGPLTDDEGAINQHTLLSALDLELRLETLIAAGDSPCLKQPDGKCFVLSPLAFWNYDRDALRSDFNTPNALSHQQNVTVAGVIVTPAMVLAGRGSYEHHVSSSKFDYANFLALSYFFPESDCFGNTEHAQWVQTVQHALSQHAEITVQIQEPTIVALEYDTNLSSSTGWSAISAFLYLAYIGFFAYVAWSFHQMDAVHSRLGVTFTALVEIAVSTITSLSVCALVGFRITMVPWELLPVVIIFVGAENMFSLVDAVGKTSVTLSVKQRIAEGLSRAGTSNTLKVVFYNATLGIIAVFAVGAVRQFCAFAIVVLVAHWFLAHTFFMAVLSIDIARLELEELLRKDTSLAPSKPPIRKESPSLKQPPSPWQKLMTGTQSLLKGRAATNISLLMLLAITATLYYSTYTATSSTAQVARHTKRPSISNGRLSNVGPNKTSAAWQIWQLLNPNQESLLHLRIETPTVVTFSPKLDNISSPKIHRPRFSMRTFRFILWLLKVMVLPIAATTSILWGLLLYLLKNTELLEAQRNRGDIFTTNKEESSLEGRISFSTLPRAFVSDVELIAASKDGQVVISVGIHNEIIIWRTDIQSHTSIDATEVLPRAASTSSVAATLTCVNIDDKGDHFGVGTGTGIISVWSMKGNQIRSFPPLALPNSSAGVTEIQFVTTLGQSPSPPGRKSSESPLTLLATYENGAATRWSIGDHPTVTYLTTSHNASVIRTSLLHVLPDDRILVAFCLNDGTLDVVEIGEFESALSPGFHIQPGNPFDVVWKVHACEAQLSGRTRLVLATATEAGTVSLWDGHTGECISILEESNGMVNHLRISPVLCETCHFCGQLPMESLSVAFSVDHVVRVFKLYLNDQFRRCSCSHSQVRHMSSRESLGRRSRSGSNAAISHKSSPVASRARLATAFETSSFPVSGHGVHSRRASEKDSGRRSSEQLTLGDDYDASNGTVTPTNPSSFWRNAIIAQLTDITCERGGWDVTTAKFVGIRRKPRQQGKSKGGTTIPMKLAPSSHGLTTATLDRWELWTYDPSVALLRSSILSSLALKPPETPSTTPPSSMPPISGECIARLPFTRVAPLLISPSHALAGFGNTVGVFNFAES